MVQPIKTTPPSREMLPEIHQKLSAWGKALDRSKKYPSRYIATIGWKGIGWQMSDGEIVYRGSETFAETTRQADEFLADTGHSAAANEIREALHDISRRPEPDVTGAIQHAMSALECTAREVSGKRKFTLGRLIPHLDLTSPLDAAVDKLWGYASERARHIREGQPVTTAEAELWS